MVRDAFSAGIYGMIGYVLVFAIVVGFFSSGLLRFWPEATVDDLEPTIRGWLADSNLTIKPASDPKWNFGLVVMLPDGEPIYVIHLKEHRRFIAFQAHLAISPEHREILETMPKAYHKKLAQEVGIKLFLAKMVHAIGTRPSDFSLFSQLAITKGLKKDKFLKHLDDMGKAILLARHTISLGMERARRNWDEEAGQNRPNPIC